MSGFDLINGCFEAFGGVMLMLNVLKLHRDKQVAGVDWRSTAFFTAWGLWNLCFYPSLDQWLSFAGGVFLVLVNAIWLGQLVYYRRNPCASSKPSEQPLQGILDLGDLAQIDWDRRIITIRRR